KIAKLQEQLKEKADQTRSLMVPRPNQGGGPGFFNPEMARAGMEQMKEAIQALHAEADDAVMQELQPKQRTRLEQIKLQADGPLAFERPDVLERLNLDPGRIEMIQTILTDGRDQMPQSGGIMVGGPGAMPAAGFGRGPGPNAGGGPGPGAG